MEYPHDVVLAGQYYASITTAERNLWSEAVREFPAWKAMCEAARHLTELEYACKAGNDRSTEMPTAMQRLDAAEITMQEAAKTWHEALIADKKAKEEEEVRIAKESDDARKKGS